MAATIRIPSYSLELTGRCINNCLYCYNVWKGSGAAPESELDGREVLDLVDKLVEEAAPGFFTLTGGEPLLREDLPALVEHIRGKGCGVLLITSGVLLEDERLAARLVRAGVSLFEITLLSHRPEVHDHLAGAPAWHRVLRGIRNVKSHGGSAALTFIATALNVPDVEETLKLALSLGADRLVFNRVNLAGEAVRHINELMPSASALLYALGVANWYGERYGLTISSTIPVPPCVLNLYEGLLPHVSINTCSIGTEQASYAISPSGLVRACTLSATVLGDFTNEKMADILRGEALTRYARALPAMCLECPWAPSCRGGCRAAAESVYGSGEKGDPFVRISLSLRRQRELFPEAAGR